MNDQPNIARQFMSALRTLLTSKRSLVVLLTALADVYVLIFAGDSIPAERVEGLAQLITVLGGMLVGGISVSDHGKAMGQPPGVDHHGRGS